jgi:hypothetical protein
MSSEQQLESIGSHPAHICQSNPNGAAPENMRTPCIPTKTPDEDEQHDDLAKLRADAAFQLEAFGLQSGRWWGCEETRQRHRLQLFIEHKNPSTKIIDRIRSMVHQFMEDEVVVDELLRFANVGRSMNVDSFLSWSVYDLNIDEPWLGMNRILHRSNFTYPTWYLSASLAENAEDDDEIREKINLMAQGTSLSIGASLPVNFMKTNFAARVSSHCPEGSTPH